MVTYVTWDDFHSQPIYEEANTQCDTDISERQTDPIYEEVNTLCDTDISERQTDFHSQPIYQDPHTDSEGLKSTPENMQIQEGEPGVDVLRECPQVKKPIFISMARKLWDRIRPQKETSKLKGPWTDHVYNIFKEKIPSCTLSFKYQHLKAPWSRKKNAPYLSMKPGCTIPSCPAKYSFTVQNNPVALDQDVQILVQQTGDIQHKLSETKARPATNQKRGKIAEALTHGPSQLYYSTLQSTPKEQLLAGNMTECLNKKVLKVIGSEMRKKAIHSLWYLHGNRPRLRM